MTDRLVPSQFATIQAAIEAAVAADRIVLEAGVDDENAEVTKNLAFLGQATNTGIVLTLADGIAVTLDGTAPFRIVDSVAAESASGNEGDNVFTLGPGADTVAGAGGTDTLDLSAATAPVIVDLGASTAASDGFGSADTISGIENVIGGSAADRLTGSTVANYLGGGAGADTALGGDGHDQMDGGAGNDALFGEADSDVLLGGSGDDTLAGGTGDDILDGGAGHDQMLGEAGKDTYVFRRGEADGDIVYDFGVPDDGLRFIGYGTAAAGASFTRLDSIHWRISSSDGTVSETITIGNGADINSGDYRFVMAPEARDDTLVASAEDAGPRTILASELLANDTDADNGSGPPNAGLTITSVGNAIGGTVALDGAGNVVFTPAANFNGTASFSYTVSDGLNLSDEAQASFTVTPTNDLPTTGDDLLTTVAEDSGPRAIAAATLLANDTGAPDSGETLSVIAVGNAVGGAVSLSGDGATITFAPAANFDGTASFDYTLSDGTFGSTDVGSASFPVTSVDDAPIALADTTTVDEDSGATAIAVLANDIDIDGGPKTIVAITQPANGTVAITGGGTGLTFTPNANFNGSDIFTYTLNGGSPATVNVTVGAVDHAPIAVVVTATVGENSGATAIDVLANDIDIDGGPKTIVAITQPGHGTVAITAEAPA